MTDISRHTIEYPILAAIWFFEGYRSISAVKKKLREQYGIERPHTWVIEAWAEKLFSIGLIFNWRRDGRPNIGETIEVEHVKEPLKNDSRI